MELDTDEHPALFHVSPILSTQLIAVVSGQQSPYGLLEPWYGTFFQALLVFREGQGDKQRVPKYQRDAYTVRCVRFREAVRSFCLRLLLWPGFRVRSVPKCSQLVWDHLWVLRCCISYLKRHDWWLSVTSLPRRAI